MTQAYPPDAAGGDLAAAASVSARPVARRKIGVGQRLAQRWWMVAASLVITLILAVTYLLLSTPIYTAMTVLSPERRVGAVNDVPPDEFLAAQRNLILSKPVLESAITSLDSKTRGAPAASAQALH